MAAQRRAPDLLLYFMLTLAVNACNANEAGVILHAQSCVSSKTAVLQLKQNGKQSSFCNAV